MDPDAGRVRSTSDTSSAQAAGQAERKRSGSFAGLTHTASKELADEPVTERANQTAPGIFTSMVTSLKLKASSFRAKRGTPQIKSGKLGLFERVARCGRRLFRSAEANVIHRSAKEETAEIRDSGLRRRITDELETHEKALSQDPSNEAAQLRRDNAHKRIKAQIQAEKQTAGLPPSQLREYLTEELAMRYIDKANGRGDDAKIQETENKVKALTKAYKHTSGILLSKDKDGNTTGIMSSQERAQMSNELAQHYLTEPQTWETKAKIAELEEKGRLSIPLFSGPAFAKMGRPEREATQKQIVRDKLSQALINQKKMELWGKLYQLKVEKFDVSIDGKHPIHPKDMTEEKFQKYSEQIDKELDAFVKSSEFTDKLESLMGQLTRTGEKLREDAQTMLDAINKKTLTDATFLANLQGNMRPGARGVPPGTALAHMLFPMRSLVAESASKSSTVEGREIEKTAEELERTAISQKQTAVGGVSILDCVTFVDKGTGKGKGLKKPLEDVRSFNNEELDKTIREDQDKLEKMKGQLTVKKTELERALPADVAKVKIDIKTLEESIIKAELMLASKKLQLEMQRGMADIKTRLDKGWITKKEAKQELRALHDEILIQYEEVRNNYSDAPLKKKQESEFLLNCLTIGMRQANMQDFSPSAASATEISGLLMDQMRNSMGFSEVDDIKDTILEDIGKGLGTVRNQLRREIDSLKRKIVSTKEEENAIGLQLHSKLLKLLFYTKLLEISNADQDKREDLMRDFEADLRTKSDKFKKSYPEAVNYGEVVTLLEAPGFSEYLKKTSDDVTKNTTKK